MTRIPFPPQDVRDSDLDPTEKYTRFLIWHQKEKMKKLRSTKEARRKPQKRSRWMERHGEEHELENIRLWSKWLPKPRDRVKPGKKQNRLSRQTKGKRKDRSEGCKTMYELCGLSLPKSYGLQRRY
jgi:hypothetical protein